MTLDEIPSFTGRRPRTQPRVRRVTPRQRLSWTRRDFLRRTAVGGMGLGLMSLAVFTPARRAYAVHGTDGYQIKGLPCPSYAADHNCDPGCGPSPIGGSSCQSDPAQHTYGYHRNTLCQYFLRKNECVTGTSWDGWLWEFTPSFYCWGCANSITFRCHDGWECSPTTCGSCSKDICRWSTSCW
jgi:hypothetical protein